MSSTRPLHELLADLAGDGDAGRAHGDPEAYLAANGHAGLPPDLVAEAVVSYADTAPVEVAEHLAPFVTTHSAVPADEPPSDVSDDWFDLLTTAPAAPTDDLDPDPGLDDDLDGDAPWSPDDDPGPGLDFGTGSADDLDAPADADDSATDNDDTSPAGTHDQPAREAWTDLEPESADLDALPAAEADEDSDEDDSDDDLS